MNRRVSRREWEHYLRGPESAHLDLNCVDMCILYAVGTWMDDDGSNAYAGIPKIAEAARKSPATVKRTLAKARTLGLLTVTERGGRRGDGTAGKNAYAATTPSSTAHPSGPLSPRSTARPDEPLSAASTAQIEASTAHQDVSTAQIGPPIGDRETALQAAAASEDLNRSVEGDDADAFGAAVTRILATVNLGPSWRKPVRTALEAGHPEAAVIDELTQPRPRARSLDAVRRQALADLAATRPAVRTRPEPSADRPTGQPEPQPTHPTPVRNRPETAPDTPPPEEEPTTRAVPALPRLRRGEEPTSLASAVAVYDTATDPVGHAMAVLNGTAPTAPAGNGHDPHTCMGCGKKLSESRKPWISNRTGRLVLYCLICRRTQKE